MQGKKGQVMSNLGGLAVGVAGLVIVLSIAFLVMGQVRTQDTDVTGITCNQTDGSIGCNATKTLQNATATIPGWVPLVILVSIGAVILGMVAAFGGRS
jgi:hypothetical protein